MTRRAWGAAVQGPHRAVSSRHGGRCLALPTAEAKHCTAARREPGEGALVFAEPVLGRRPRGPGSEAQWAPPSSLKNQVGCLRGRTACAFSCHRAGAGRRLPPEDSTALLPAPMETSLVDHETWVFPSGHSWGTVATRKVNVDVPLAEEVGPMGVH